MSPDTRNSPNALAEPIINIRPGLAIYRVNGSRYWQARIRDTRNGRYKVVSTKETSRIKARLAAEELAADSASRQPSTPRDLTFKHYAARCLARMEGLVARGERNPNYVRTARLFLEHEEWGLLTRFSQSDVRTLVTRDFQSYRETLIQRRADLSLSTLNMLAATFRNVMKLAAEDGVIAKVPDTPRLRQRDNPRPFFRFYPLVPREQDAFNKLLIATQDLVKKETIIRGVPVTEELYDLTLFVTHSFVRPISSELYALKHNDVQVADNPRRLLLTIRDGKTGSRISNTMPIAVAIYERIKRRYPEAKGEDYLFLPGYTNRSHASRIIANQFNAALRLANVKQDVHTGKLHSVYSLRHTAICMRIIHSEGEVNIFNLAKNAGTSVDQIERFYARQLPLSPELARNLQSFPK